MRIKITSFLCMAILAAFSFSPQLTQSAFAEESAAQPAPMITHAHNTSFYGKSDANLVRSTLVYLFPEEVLKLNEKIVTNYASDPGTTYQNFLSYQDQVLYWALGRHIIRDQLVADVPLYQNMMLRHPMFTTVGYRSFLTDPVGAYKDMFLFVNNMLNPYEQF